MDAPPPWVDIWLLSIMLLAACTDARSGLIPNWLTFPTLVAAPVVHGLVRGPGALGAALAGLLVCGLVPLLLFRLRAIGGGDVKLLAAAGALAGMRVGLELQLASYLLCSVYALLLLAWRGSLLATLRRSLVLAGAAISPRLRARLPASDEMMQVRLGPAVFAASFVTVACARLGL
jgi:prepilin peptidase CpaA